MAWLQGTIGCACLLALGCGGDDATARDGGDGDQAEADAGDVDAEGGGDADGGDADDAGGDDGSTPPVACGTGGAVFYISPSGDDGADGRSESTPMRTFAAAFGRMTGGDELVLLDGTYSDAAGTGHIGWEGEGSAQIPSGPSRARPTCVHAAHPGNVRVVGALFLGRSDRKDGNILVQGLTFDGGGELYNTSFVTIRDCGFHDESNGGGAVFGIGTNDHDAGNDDNLIEDCWIWGRDRIIAINYRSTRNVWRRVVVRGDGCDGAECVGSGNPNVGITVYDSSEITLENVIVVDRILGGGEPYADFAVAQHTPGRAYGGNRWLGTISLGAPDQGYYFEPDEASLEPAQRLVDCVAWNAADSGINVARAGATEIERCTFHTLGGDGVRVAPELADSGSVVRNVLITGAGRFGSNSAVAPSYLDVFGAWTEGDFNQAACAAGCVAVDPAQLYLTRIEAGSPVAAAGEGGAPIGATVVRRYGADGSRWGDPGYDALGASLLWPWPNEARMRAEMCESTTRGFCSAASFTRYVWEYLGHPMPSSF
jgi:hypothetical protein